MQTKVIQGRNDFFQHASILSPLKQGAYIEDDRRTFYATGLNHAPCNGVWEKQEERLTEKEIDLAIHFFGSKKVPFIWWSGDKLLEKKGFLFGGVFKGIYLDLTGITFQTPTHVTKRVETEQDMQRFGEILFESMSLPQELRVPFVGVLKAAMDKGEQAHFLSYSNGVPVATITLATSHLSAGLWNGATLPGFRKQGHLTALVERALLEAKKTQYKGVMALLMAQEMAAGVCRSFGFKECVEFPFYMYSQSC